MNIFKDIISIKEVFSPDVESIKDEAIRKYGPEEWWMVALTSEIHGHLGIYAILGAKMGLFTREVLGAGYDELKITSFAGSKPPVSCLNDGLQVSTGATLGHGLISVKELNKPIVAAEIKYKSKTVLIYLDEEIQHQIEGTIRGVLAETGGMTAEYWQRIRELGIEVWLNYDRNNIFNVK